jgi:N-acetylglucosaminyldiphosphoundecaprenol N-acetyl-beta-D-mannosaminyltransferase
VSVRRLTFGPVPIDSVTMGEALDEVERMVTSGAGGAVFTPNVDHIVIASENPRMRTAYARATLSIVDGTPVVWASRLFDTPLPERVPGSDFVPRVLERAAERGWRVYFLGGAPGVSRAARDKLRATLPKLEVVGIDEGRIGVDDPPEARERVMAPIRAARANLVFVALGAPKQEIWIDACRDALPGIVFFGIGASLDFIAGTMPRAPRWMGKTGTEWLFRLSREPKRLWRRYLVQDPKFLLILARALRDARRPVRPVSER